MRDGNPLSIVDLGRATTLSAFACHVKRQADSLSFVGEGFFYGIHGLWFIGLLLKTGKVTATMYNGWKMDTRKGWYPGLHG